jgi:hypothetical protein
MPGRNKAVPVKIRVEEVSQRHLVNPIPPPLQDFGNVNITPRPIVKIDPETWVSRIMHPWLESDAPVWCPENWNCGQKHIKSDKGELPDDATIASNSGESTTSSKMNDVSSITPFLPGHTTSSEMNGDENHGSYSNEKKEERGRGREVPTSILGIMDRKHLEDQGDDGIVVEAVRSRGRKLDRTRTPPPPPPGDDSYVWDEDRVTFPANLASSSPSLRRRQCWETLMIANDNVKNIAAEVHKNRAIEDSKSSSVAREFDLESLTASDAVYFELGLSGRTAEI